MRNNNETSYHATQESYTAWDFLKWFVFNVVYFYIFCVVCYFVADVLRDATGLSIKATFITALLAAAALIACSKTSPCFIYLEAKLRETFGVREPQHAPKKPTNDEIAIAAAFIYQKAKQEGTEIPSEVNGDKIISAIQAKTRPFSVMELAVRIGFTFLVTLAMLYTFKFVVSMLFQAVGASQVIADVIGPIAMLLLFISTNTANAVRDIYIKLATKLGIWQET